VDGFVEFFCLLTVLVVLDDDEVDGLTGEVREDVDGCALLVELEALFDTGDRNFEIWASFSFFSFINLKFS
jgi:hypothetical protein